MDGKKRNPMTGRKKAIIAMILCGFGAIEFPGILFIGHLVTPKIFGFPFLYGYLIICWIYMVLVLFYAWRTRWGKEPFRLF